MLLDAGGKVDKITDIAKLRFYFIDCFWNILKLVSFTTNPIQ